MSEKQFNIQIEIAKRLASGMTQKEISDELKRLGISPNSLSSIEKILKNMRDEMKCKTIVEMIVKLSKMKII